MADRMVVRTEGRSVDQMEVPKVGQMEGRSAGLMAGLMVVRTEDRLVGQMAVQTVDRSVDLKEGLMEVRLVGPQDLSEVRAALHQFAQLVLVQARLQALRALVVLGLEVVFA